MPTRPLVHVARQRPRPWTRRSVDAWPARRRASAEEIPLGRTRWSTLPAGAASPPGAGAVVDAAGGGGEPRREGERGGDESGAHAHHYGRRPTGGPSEVDRG